MYIYNISNIYIVTFQLHNNYIKLILKIKKICEDYEKKKK